MEVRNGWWATPLVPCALWRPTEASAAWPHSQPSDALRAACLADPTLAAGQADFTDVIGNVVGLSVAGLLVRQKAILPVERPPSRDRAGSAGAGAAWRASQMWPRRS
jgi:hypothetical protein